LTVAVDLDPTTHVEVTANACGHVDTGAAEGTEYAEAEAHATHPDHPNPPPLEPWSHTADARGWAGVASSGSGSIAARTSLDFALLEPVETCGIEGDVYGTFTILIDSEGVFPDGTPLQLHIKAPYHNQGSPPGWSISTAWTATIEGQEIDEEWMELDVFSGETLDGTFDLAVNMSKTGFGGPPENVISGGDVDMYLTPEPATLSLLALGGLALLRRRRGYRG
jgi:hypothetical protein